MMNNKMYIDRLLCPQCGSQCEDVQQDSQEENKEEYCGNCDTQFGYHEHVTEERVMDHFMGLSRPMYIKTITYHSFKID